MRGIGTKPGPKGDDLSLIHTVLRRADALRNTLIPISTVFAGDTHSFIAGPTGYPADLPELDEWVAGFAQRSWE